MEQVILKTRSGDYVGDGGTFNSQRDYAKRFQSEEEGREYAKSNRMHADFIAEAA